MDGGEVNVEGETNMEGEETDDVGSHNKEEFNSSVKKKSFLMILLTLLSLRMISVLYR